MEFIFVRKNTSRDRYFSQQKSASLDLRVLYYMYKTFSLSFDDWKSLSSDFHVVTPLQLTPQPEKGSILECFGDIPWCCTCTRKIERGIGGYQNTRCCLHVMHASITVSGLEDPPDLRDDLIGKQKRGRKRIHGRQARTNRYGAIVRKPAKKRKVNKERF